MVGIGTQRALCVLLKIILSGLLFIAVGERAYDYYEFLRVVGFIALAIIAYFELGAQKNGFALFWFLSALILNPFFKVTLQKNYWVIVDLLLGLTLISTALWEIFEFLKEFVSRKTKMVLIAVIVLIIFVLAMILFFPFPTKTYDPFNFGV
jgi:hypothetical protein